jgi:hypothetical protein
VNQVCCFRSIQYPRHFKSPDRRKKSAYRLSFLYPNYLMDIEHTNPTNINTKKRSQYPHPSPFPSYPESRDPLLPKLNEKNLPDPGLSSDQMKLRWLVGYYRRRERHTVFLMLRAFDRGTTVYAGAASAPEDGAAVSCQGRRRCSWLGAAGRGTACFLGFSGAGGQRRCSVLVTGKGGGGGRSRSRRGGGGGRGGDREGQRWWGGAAAAGTGVAVT